MTTKNDYDVAARMAEIIGKPLRVESLREDEFDAEARQLTAKLQTACVGGDDVILNVIRFMHIHPGLFRPQIQMSIELAGNGSITPREREFAILRNAWLCGAQYEMGPAS